MVATYRDSSEAHVDGVDTLNIPWPAVATHDRALLLVGADMDSGGTMTAPSGFTSAATAVYVANDGQKLWAFEKKDCAGTETGNVAIVTPGLGFSKVAILLTFAGCDNSAALTFITPNSDATSRGTPIATSSTSGTTGSNGAVVVVGYALDLEGSGDVWDFAAPAGFTQRQAASYVYSHCAAFTQDSVAASTAVGTVSATATRTSGGSNAAWASFVVAIPAAAGGGPTNTPMTISVTQTQTASRLLAVGASKSQTAVQTASRLRAISSSKSATAAQTATRARAVGAIKSATAVQVPSRARVVGLARLVTQAQTPSLAQRALARALLVVAVQVSAVVRALARALSVTQTQTGTANIDQAGSGAHTMTLSATVTQTVATIRDIGRQLSGLQSQAPTRLRALPRTVGTVTSAQVPTRLREVGRTRSATQTQAASSPLRTVGHFLAATAAQALSVSRALGRPVSASQTQVPAATKGQGYFKTFSATATQSPARAVALGVNRAATAAQSFVVTRALHFALSVVQAQVTSLARAVARPISAIAAQTPTDKHGRVFFVDLAATSGQTPTAQVDAQLTDFVAASSRGRVVASHPVKRTIFGKPIKRTVS